MYVDKRATVHFHRRALERHGFWPLKKDIDRIIAQITGTGGTLVEKDERSELWDVQCRHCIFRVIWAHKSGKLISVYQQHASNSPDKGRGWATSVNSIRKGRRSKHSNNRWRRAEGLEDDEEGECW